MMMRGDTASGIWPTISLVTPNYNGAGYLRDALDSVVSQDYPALDYVVVDGASTDGSGFIIEHYRSALSDVIIEPDDGHADALNKGFARTHGDIMGWINSDDRLHPNSIKQIARIFETYPEVEWVTGRPTAMNSAGEADYVGPVRPWSRLRFLAGDPGWIQQESTFWRRSLWDRAGGGLDTQFLVANDFDLWARFFRHAHLYSTDLMLGCFRVRPGQRSVEQSAQYDAEMKTILARELTAAPETFRRAFADLLPDHPRRLSPEARAALEPRLRALDPPVIRSGTLHKGERLEPGGPRFGVGLFSPEPASDLSRLKDIHKGERCFILGNGPSLNKTDLSKLAGETVFGCNAVFLLFDRIAWRPQYYTCVDSQVLPDRAADIKAMLDTHPSMTAFFPAELHEHGGARRRIATRSLVANGPGRYFFHEEPGSLDDLPWSMFSMDASDRVIQPHTVAITMLQIAAHMGFSEIYLVGVDMRYTLPDGASRQDAADRQDSRLVSNCDDDPNHFDPTYFGAGRRWHVPNVRLMREHFAIARKALEANGVTVRNATAGGDLDVFERIDLADVPSGAQRTAAPARPVRTSRTAALPSRAPSLAKARMTRVKTTVSNNRRFLGAAGIAGLGFITAAVLLAEWRYWIALTGGLALCFAFTGALAIKTRRIVNQLAVQLKRPQEGHAESELSRQQIELELEDLKAQLAAKEAARK